MDKATCHSQYSAFPEKVASHRGSLLFLLYVINLNSSAVSSAAPESLRCSPFFGVICTEARVAVAAAESCAGNIQSPGVSWVRVLCLVHLVSVETHQDQSSSPTMSEPGAIRHSVLPPPHTGGEGGEPISCSPLFTPTGTERRCPPVFLSTWEEQCVTSEREGGVSNPSTRR